MVIEIELESLRARDLSSKVFVSESDGVEMTRVRVRVDVLVPWGRAR